MRLDRPRRPRRLLQQRHGREADDQPDADDPEGVAVGHDIGFAARLRGDEAERLVVRGDEAAGSMAMPIEPPRLRIMLESAEASAVSRGPRPAVDICDSGTVKSGCPAARKSCGRIN